MTAGDPSRVCYLVSQYPAISHTFILREIRCLRGLGFDISTASINGVDRPMAALTYEEREEASNTFYVKKCGLLKGALVGMKAFCLSPLSFFRGLGFALKLCAKNMRSLIRAPFYFVEALLVADWMTQQNGSHLHVHFANPASTVALIVKKLIPVTLSMTVHGPDVFDQVESWHLPEKIRECLFVSCISQFARSQLMRWSTEKYWDRLQVLPLGINPTIFQASKRSHAPSLIELLCVGRLVGAKGQGVLIQAMSVLVSKGASVRLCLIGDGPQRECLKRLVEREKLSSLVCFEGAVNQDEIGRYYQSADIFVLPSFAEGLPIVLMEAMAMELPVVSTYVNGIPELIREEKEGLLVPPADVDALAGALMRMVRDPILRGELGRAGRLRVMEKYSLEQNVAALAAQFHSQHP